MGGRSAPLPLLTTETQLLEMLGNGAPMMEVLNVYSIFHSGRVISTLLIVQDYSEKRVVHFDFAVIFDETQLPELVHEQIHPRTRRTDHCR
jgi:hypothetical protein